MNTAQLCRIRTVSKFTNVQKVSTNAHTKSHRFKLWVTCNVSVIISVCADATPSNHSKTNLRRYAAVIGWIKGRHLMGYRPLCTCDSKHVRRSLKNQHTNAAGFTTILICACIDKHLWIPLCAFVNFETVLSLYNSVTMTHDKPEFNWYKVNNWWFTNILMHLSQPSSTIIFWFIWLWMEHFPKD